MDKEDVQAQDESPEDELKNEIKNHPNVFSPAVKTIQRIALYETKSRFYVVGSNNTQSKFRVLKIDRMDPRKLNISDDTTVYTNREIRDLLNMIDGGNRSKIPPASICQAPHFLRENIYQSTQVPANGPAGSIGDKRTNRVAQT